MDMKGVGRAAVAVVRGVAKLREKSILGLIDQRATSYVLEKFAQLEMTDTTIAKTLSAIMKERKDLARYKREPGIERVRRGLQPLVSYTELCDKTAEIITTMPKKQAGKVLNEMEDINEGLLRQGC